MTNNKNKTQELTKLYNKPNSLKNQPQLPFS